jgi:hypothetical protein
MNLHTSHYTTQPMSLKGMPAPFFGDFYAKPLRYAQVHSPQRAAWLEREPHLWRKGTVSRVALACEADQLRAHPDFAKTYRHYAAQTQKTIVNNWALNRVMCELGRCALTAFTLYLHHSKQTGMWGEVGVTYARITELFAAGALTKEGALASPSRIKALLGMAEIAGHIERYVPSLPVASHNIYTSKVDRRMKLLRPTAELTQPSLLWLRSFLQCIEPVTPLVMSPDAMVSLPNFLGEVMSYHVLSYVHDQYTPREEFDSVQQFIQRSGSYLTLLEIMSNLRRENGVWVSSAAPVALAKRLNISRNTIRNLLVESEQKGWMRIIDRGAHHIELSDAFADECERWLACEMVWMAGVANAAALRLQSLNHHI